MLVRNQGTPLKISRSNDEEPATSLFRPYSFAQVVTVQKRPGSSPDRRYRSTWWLCVAGVSPGPGRIGSLACLVALYSRRDHPPNLRGFDPGPGSKPVERGRVTVEYQPHVERSALRDVDPGPRGVSRRGRPGQRSV